MQCSPLYLASPPNLVRICKIKNRHRRLKHSRELQQPLPLTQKNTPYRWEDFFFPQTQPWWTSKPFSCWVELWPMVQQRSFHATDDDPSTQCSSAGGGESCSLCRECKFSSQKQIFFFFLQTGYLTGHGKRGTASLVYRFPLTSWKC